MATDVGTRASIADLYDVEGKAELIGGRLVHLMATGRRPNKVGYRICKALDDYQSQVGEGEFYTDNMGFVVAELSSGRESFSPDVSYYVGPFPENEMRFILGPPTFAVEIRSEGDYGKTPEREMAAKRADYFEAGTLVVWDVDPENEMIRSFRLDRPEEPEVFRRGEQAHAEPALPGWRLDVDRIFGPIKAT